MLGMFNQNSKETRLAKNPSRLNLETLEARITPATYVVTNLNDSGAGSLRAAIAQVNADPFGQQDTVTFAVSGTIYLSSGQIAIGHRVDIQGPGAGSVTIDGQQITRIFDIEVQNFSNANVDQPVTITGLTMQNGTGGNGGAILSNYSLDLENDYFTNNQIGGFSSGGAVAEEQSIFGPNNFLLQIENSTFNGNEANNVFGNGGAIDVSGGRVLIVQSTFTNNQSYAAGGAIHLLNTTYAKIYNSTIVSNVSANDGTFVFGQGAVSSSQALTLFSDLIAANYVTDPTFFPNNPSAEIDVSASVLPFSTNNLIGNSYDLSGITNGVRGNIIGTPTIPINPHVGTIGYYGGQIPTVPLVFGSQAIDAGSNPLGLAFDERGPGFNRIVNGTPDIGAYEFGAGFTTPATNLTPLAYAVGAGPGAAPVVNVYNTNGTLRFNIMAYDPSFRGGVHVAVGDVMGTGYDDIIVAPASGGGPDVRVFDGVTGQLVASFFAYYPAFTGGVNLAVGDVYGNGYDDIITGAGPGGGPAVAVFDGKTDQLMQSYFAFSPSYTYGVSVAVGDFYGTGTPEIATSLATGGPPIINIFGGNSGQLVGSFFGFGAGYTLGVNVAAGDLTGAGHSELVYSTNSKSNIVAVLDLETGQFDSIFLAYPSFYRTGVQVNTVTESAGAPAQIITSSGPGTSPLVEFYNASGTQSNSFFPFEYSFLGGGFVG